MAVRLVIVDRIAADCAVVLIERGMKRDAALILKCQGYKPCDRPYCPRCLSRRAYLQREHLRTELPKLLASDPTLQVWFITGVTADSLDVNSSARGAVIGMKRLLKHPRIQRRVVATFSALEVSRPAGRTEPCAHVHSLVVTRPMDSGRHRISEADWVSIWEESCPLARQRAPGKMTRKTRQPKVHLSIVVERVPLTEPDELMKVMQYATKLATPAKLANYFRPLLANPDEYIARMDALVGVTRYFGPLHRRRSKPAEPEVDSVASR